MYVFASSPDHRLSFFSFKLKAGLRAVEKRAYLVIIRDNFCYFCIKTYVVTSHLKRLEETVKMRGTTYDFDEK